jgi:type III secretory pathway component EscV
VPGPDDVRTRVLLSFSSAYVALARELGHDLGAAGIDVRYDQWEGGGGLPAVQSVASDLSGVAFVMPLLTPSAAAPTWIGDEWRRAIYDEARRRRIDLLPVCAAGEPGAVPEFLHDASYANLRDRRAFELRRLIATIRERSGDEGITVPVAELDADAGAGVAPSADAIVLDIGSTLAPAFEGDSGRRFVDEMVPMMYDGLFYALGVQYPTLRLRFESDLPPASLRIMLHDIPEAEMSVRPGCVLVNDRAGRLRERGFTATAGTNPATGADAAWIPAGEATAAHDAGLTVWDTQGLLILLLSAVLQRKAAAFVGVPEVERMLTQVAEVFPHLVAETVPKTVSTFVLTDVLRRLLAESVSIRDARRILLALAEWGRVERDPAMLTEYVRAALQRQITHQFTRGTNQVVVFLLDPALEQVIRQSIRHTDAGSYIDLAPADLEGIITAIRQAVATLPNYVQFPQILTTMDIRAPVRRLVATALPWMHVVSYQNVRPETTIQPIGRISFDGLATRGGVTVDGESLWPEAPT